MAAQPTKKMVCTALSAKSKRGTGEYEPVTMWTRFGKGRCFNLVLGHDVEAMRNTAWRTLLLRGTEWAAAGKVTIPIPKDWPATQALSAVSGVDADTALKAISTYKFPQSRKGLALVEKLVQCTATDSTRRKLLAAKMAAMLDSEATLDSRKFLCQQLSIIGSEREVPALAKLLPDRELSLAARSALERIPGEPALAAMRGTLGQLKGPLLVGTINSLGARRDAKAVAAIAKHIGSQDPQVAETASAALGKIATRPAAEALMASSAKGAAEAMLSCAEAMLARGETGQARAVYKSLSEPTQPKHVRIAAFPGLVACEGDRASELLLAALTGADQALQAAAVRCVRTAGGAGLTRVLAEQLATFPPTVRVGIISGLADRGDRVALPAIVQAAKSEDPQVRGAALAALGPLGDASTVPLLAQLAAKAEGRDQSLARKGLVRVQGQDVDAAILKLMEGSDALVRREMILALSARGTRSAVPTLLRAAKDPDRDVRREAVKALGALADSPACPSLIDLLSQTKSAAERRGLENGLVAICRRNQDRDKRAAPILAGLGAADVRVRCSLLRVLSKVGGEQALEALRAAVKNENAEVRTAAIRSLAEWPDSAALDDLLAIARSAKETVPKVLALRGFAQLAANTRDLSAQQMTQRLREALQLAERPDEKKALLGALGGAHCWEAMKLATSYLEEAVLADEAALAVVQMAPALVRSHRGQVRAALAKALSASKAPALRQQATAVVLKLAKPRNLALGATATSPDGLNKDGASHGDQAAIDGNLATYWDEVNDKKLYRLRVAFKEPTDVSAISIVAWQHHSYAARDFEILCDDQVVKTVEGAVYDSNELIVAFPATRCSALELKITGYYPQSPAIRELGIYHPGAEDVSKLERTAVPKEPKLGWRQTDDTLALLNHGRVVWQHNHRKSEGKPYFHPVSLIDGTELTWLRPPDHPWHRALWFSWKFIDRLNYWEEDRKTGHSQGRTELVKIEAKAASDHSARIEMTLSYHPPDKPAVLTEKRLIAISAPGKEGRYHLDWQSTFVAADADVVLDRTPIKGQKGGKGHGGYAGLSARLPRDTSDWQVVDSEGRRDTKAHGQKARWLDFSAETESGPAGVAILDHPQNLRHPSPWYVTMSTGVPFGYFSPAVLFREPHTLRAGQSLALRYRVLIHPGRVDRAHLDGEWKDFAQRTAE